MKKLVLIIPAIFLIFSCEKEVKEIEVMPIIEVVKANFEYGYDLNEFEIIRDTIRSGDTFGAILDANHVPQGEIYEVVLKIKDSFDVRRVKVGNPYVLLNSKDSIGKTQVFIYEKNKVDFAVIDLRDCVSTYNDKKPVTFVEKSARGVITSSLSQTMEEQHLSPNMTDQLATIYAWTIDFFRLQPGDRFKVVYSEKYINDTIPAGLGEIKAVMFEHRGKPIYAFSFIGDSIMGITDYYDEEANNLRRAFLKAPVKFSRISSRYNLKRRIKFYGNRVRPHKGTDFAAPIGTPILATADGVVTKSERRGGNGKYVKIRHNGTYETQYLHMKTQNVKKGQHVRQGDVIGWIGMTGNTGGPHVCYRFWKNGKQVDPFKQDLPLSEPLHKKHQDSYFAHIMPLKKQLDSISF
ncbi:MAG: peptidoglycan DD-metalloendopeptidase family protein [Flavobacteriaceae bacterium]|nr:peptidoglycan DD-metalloendopeptidase family protein [Flavobacteriaceae bacterium]